MVIPSLLSQAARSRETEAISNLAAINRVQIAHRFEYGTFGLNRAYQYFRCCPLSRQ
ncbi:hypothetical protein VB715_20895 [Crocosphaera sp. UHCC 0190]|uniref:hypothetical protein n=1 Tax=Crocosphaera sp. UHCC 0190 TaxID=3110246 RepID=UPI002B1F9D36|nr:hypothetical protein [Crocosphaera sp. UHCC 0190]MEA5512234.1 hypothetical protein [Crocosphaera sp. UHCC 0190]